VPYRRLLEYVLVFQVFFCLPLALILP
jgi:hypothetical protein